MVKNITALLMLSILVHCEWQGLFTQLFERDNCCSTSCCAKSCGDNSSGNKNDDANNTAGQVKNCCSSCCCYLPVFSSDIYVFSTLLKINFMQLLAETISFSSSCFHPPEIL